MTTRSLRRAILYVAAIVVGLTQMSVRSQLPSNTVLLVVNESTNPFSRYLEEILRTEGITDVTTVPIASLDSAALLDARLVVLAETPLTPAQALLFDNYVAAGGRVVAMRPDAQLDASLGVTTVGTTIDDGYMLTSQASVSGAGFPGVTLPFHGTANHYTLAPGAQPVATLYSDRTTPTPYPAVVRFGNTATWSFDLARSVIYARQGNPANAGVDRDGLPPVRTNDVFYNEIDLDRVAIPHADFHMRLFSRVVEDMLADAFPLPRLWYFPGAARTILVPTSDSHANLPTFFDLVISSVEARGAPISMYVAPGEYPDSATVSAWRANGHEVGMHPHGFPTALSSGYQTNLDHFITNGLGLPSPTVRNHLVEWEGWTDAALVASGFGVRLDTSFYTWGPGVTYPDGTQAHGYITGSGLPMRFVDEAGTLLPIYQQVTALVDEQLVTGPFSEHLSVADALAVSRQLIDESEAGGYSAIVTQFHTDYYGFAEVQPWAEGTMDYASSQGIPMWTAERWLAYTESKNASLVAGIDWIPNSRLLRFTIDVPSDSEAQTIVLRTIYDGRAISGAQIDGTPTTTTQQVINGRPTAFLIVPEGTHLVEVVYDDPIPSNQDPIATDDVIETPQDVTAVVPVLANDNDPDGDPLMITSFSQGTIGVVTVNPDGSITYTPVAGQCGTDEFTYTVNDGRGGSDNGTVNVTVACPGLPPTAVDDVAGTNAGVPVTVLVLVNDSDPDQDPLTVVSVTQPPNGTATINLGTTVTYTPDPGYCGSDAFTYTIGDGNGWESTATISITIACLPGLGGATTVTFQVASGTDDVSEDGAAFDADDSPFWVGNSSASSYTGIRLTNVSIPAGAAIQSARLEFYSTGTQWIGLNLSIGAHAAGNSPGFSDSSRPSQLPLTGAVVGHLSDVQWQANTWYTLQDVAPVVQELVNRPDWTPGNSLSIVLHGLGIPFARKVVSSFEQNAAFAPRLVVVYAQSSATFQVSGGADDVTEVDTTFEVNPSPFWVGNAASPNSHVGIRLTNVGIPEGSTIQSARLEFHSTQSQWIGLSASIAADAAGNSAPFSAQNRPSQRTLTAQSVDHASNTQWLSSTWYTLEDIAPVIQEIVDRPDWSPGNSISIIIRGTGSPFSRKFVSSFEQGSSLAPRLVVTIGLIPVISNVTSGNITQTSASITWQTSGPATSQVQYGLTSAYGSSTTLDGTQETVHSQTITGLTPDTTYHYRVMSTNAAGYQSISNDFTFTTAPLTAADTGQWSSVINWPLVAVHATLLHTGNVLLWDAWEIPQTTSGRVWNPVTQQFTLVPIPDSALFCAGHSMLADGRKLIVGGAHAAGEGIADTNIFDPATGAFTRVASMAVARWYPSTVTLGDGRVIALGGEIHSGMGTWADTPEVYDPTSDAWTSLPGATLNLGNYPRSFLAPDGRVFVVSGRTDSTSRYLDVDSQTWADVGLAPIDGSGSSAGGGGVVMYRPGKLLTTGWSASSGPAAVIDLNQTTPAWRSIAPMQYGRFMQNVVMLPDGQVLVVGGATEEDLVATDGVLPSEIWNPDNETWTTVAAISVPRMYHSHALLLPDGRVLVAGGGRLEPAVDYPSAQIYSPPYLFKGPRPVITSAPATTTWGGIMTVPTPDAGNIASVALLRLPSVTHGIDFDQRYIPLSFTAGSNELTVQAPADVNTAPPGDYMLFIVNGGGVPSTAAMVRVAAPANQPPVITTATASPTSGPAPLAVDFAGAATDSEGAPVTYLWTFGDGTTGNGANVSHTYTASGPYTATLTVSDGVNQTVSAPLMIQVGSPPSAVITAPGPGLFQAGATITYAGSATDPDETLDSSAFSWSVYLHHDTHTHLLEGPVSGVASGAYQVPTSAAGLGGHDFSGTTRIEVRLTVTDSDGLQDTESAFVDPQKVNLSFATAPAGLSLSFDGASANAPFVRDTVVGFQHTISAPASQSLGAATYDFQSWSDGGTVAHIVTAPASATTYTAAYMLRVGPTVATFQVSAGADDVSEVNNTFEFDASPFWVGNANSQTASFTGIRLNDVTIPAGAVIQSARLELHSTSSQWLAISMSIAADASGNSLPLSATSRPSARPLTTSAIAHASDTQWLANTWYTLDDIAPVIQEIVNRSDWATGNSLSIILQGAGSTWARKFVSSFEQSSALAPRLVVVYEGAADLPPEITSATATPTDGPAPLTVNFAGAAIDPEGQPLTYLWTFGDGETASGATVSHTYTETGVYSATLTVSDASHQIVSSPLTIQAGSPPTAAITAPSPGTFEAGATIAYAGTATDPDETLGVSAFSWSVFLHHDAHTHLLQGPVTGVANGSYQVPTTSAGLGGHDFSGATRIEVRLTVTDSDGFQDIESAFVDPQKVNLSFVTEPAGLNVVLDGSSRTAPFVRDTIVGFQHSITAAATQSLGALTYDFQSWSDGGAATHTITVPASNTTYTATYLLRAGPSTATFQVSAGNDDVTEINGTFDANASPFWIGNANSQTASYAGIRLTNVSVLAGSTIQSARLEFNSSSTQWVGLSISIAADATGDSAPLSATSRPSQRPLTGAAVSHASNTQWLAGTWYTLQDIAPVIQEIVSRPDWMAGNSISIILRGTGNNWARKFVNSFEQSSAVAPRLVVTYDTPAP